MASRLSDDEVTAGLARLAGWSREGDAIVKEFKFPGFADAIAFVVQVGFVAETVNHHPDIDIRWNKVQLLLTTHDADGLTALDLSLAESIDGVAAERRAGD